MPFLEKPKLSIAFTWQDEHGENSYETGMTVQEPVTREGIEQSAAKIASIVATFLELEGIIQPPQPKEGT